MNAPVLTTQRLILRPFAQQDAPALLRLLGDEEVNRFLPWYPVKSLKEALAFYREHFASRRALAYAVCLRQEDLPIGYVQVSLEEPHDFGYALRREFWGQGITTEAARAVLEQLKKAGLPYITATHDRNNPRSGGVMRKLGMHYCYSYQEQWQPKDFPVIFRMYQLNLDGQADRVYRGYWDISAVRFVEPGL